MTTNNKKIAEKLKLMRNLGFTKKRFVHYIAGYNFRLTGYQAALALSQLKRINSIIKKGDNTFFNTEIRNLLTIYNIDLDTFIKDYCSYIIRNNMSKITITILKEMEFIIHNIDNNENNKLNLLFYALS